MCTTTHNEHKTRKVMPILRWCRELAIDRWCWKVKRVTNSSAQVHQQKIPTSSIFALISWNFQRKTPKGTYRSVSPDPNYALRLNSMNSFSTLNACRWKHLWATPTQCPYREGYCYESLLRLFNLTSHTDVETPLDVYHHYAPST